MAEKKTAAPKSAKELLADYEHAAASVRALVQDHAARRREFEVALAKEMEGLRATKRAASAAYSAAKA
jgi:hypothetical protein